ncbi:hypothetical protein MRB53_024654 [Persea americana]|uniref:Uncharacterized protein n=1 Tax=Persea americana TaxID=3435 RepID=A0ACC2LD05_PERAE|nr:hypothetical protein MRB53_024654 [Persea americana]
MARSKDDVKYGTAQAKLNEDESLRVAYKAGTPIEAGKIAESEPLQLFSVGPCIFHAQPNPNHDNRPSHAHDDHDHDRDDPVTKTNPKPKPTSAN